MFLNRCRTALHFLLSLFYLTLHVMNTSEFVCLFCFWANTEATQKQRGAICWIWQILDDTGLKWLISFPFIRQEVKAHASLNSNINTNLTPDSLQGRPQQVSLCCVCLTELWKGGEAIRNWRWSGAEGIDLSLQGRQVSFTGWEAKAVLYSGKAWN